jgi:shikimate dehydrogenase
MQRRMLVGLIGANIQGSLSPALFEDACTVAGIRGHYHLMDLDQLPGRGLADLLAAARAAGFAGLNVTYPCKQSVLPLLDEVASEARQIGAVNTVAIAGEGKIRGYNTDRIGFRRAFEETLGREAGCRQTVLLVGAGGAGRAVAYALFDVGIKTLLICDRDRAQAERLTASLVADFGRDRARVEIEPRAALANAAGVVNATPVGMLGIPGIPIPVDAIAPEQWVADVIYTPLETELIKAARDRGARVMGGAGMCVHQAAETFRIFTGLAPDVHRMRGVFVEAAADRDYSLAEARQG